MWSTGCALEKGNPDAKATKTKRRKMLGIGKTLLEQVNGKSSNAKFHLMKAVYW